MLKTIPFRLALIVIVLMGLLALGGCSSKHGSGSSGGGSGEPLKVGVIPFETADKIKTAYKPFAEYLGKKCGTAGGQVFVSLDYSGILQALRSDQIDCAYLNPLSYALAVKEAQNTPEHLIPIAMPYFHNSATYKGIIFVRKDSGINSIQDFKGKSFVFGDVTSTSGYLYPAGMMQEAGIDPKKDVKAVNVGGGQNVLAVLHKQADGGATFEGGIELAVPKVSDQQQLKVIATTDPIPNGMFVARGNLDPAILQKLQAAMVSVNTDAEGIAALKAMQYDKWVAADDHAFDSVRQKATILGLNLQSLDAGKKK